MTVIFHDLNFDVIKLKLILHENLPNEALDYEFIPDQAYVLENEHAYSSRKLHEELCKLCDTHFIAITTKNLSPKVFKHSSSSVIALGVHHNTIKLVGVLVAKSLFCIHHQYNSINSLNHLEIEPEQNAILGRITYNSQPKSVHVVISHGICSHAHWAETALEILSENRISTSIFRYDWVDIISFLFWQSKRKQYAKEMLARLNRARDENPYRNLSVSVHSFGSIVLAKALELAQQLETTISIDLILISGGILPQNYDWQKFRQKDEGHNTTIRRVVNICGERDFLPILAKAFVKEAGISGSFFFADNYSGGVKNIRLPNKNHSSILDKDVVEAYWAPYLVSASEDSHPIVKHIPPSNGVKIWAAITKIVNKNNLFIGIVLSLVYYLIFHSKFINLVLAIPKAI